MNLCLHAETNNDTLLASALWGQDISCAKLEKKKDLQAKFISTTTEYYVEVSNKSRVHSSRTPLSSPTRTQNKMKIKLLVLPVTLV